MTDLTEHQIQKIIVQYLDLVLPPFIRVVACSNNERNRVAAHRAKERGMRKGYPDLTLIGAAIKAETCEPERCLVLGLIEVKTTKGSLTKEQREWRDWAKSTGIPWGLARSVDDVRDLLEEWRIRAR